MTSHYYRSFGMGKVSATDANRHFSKLLRQVENGERITITKDGKPVAVLAPVGHPDAGEREAALQHMAAVMRQGVPLGYTGPLNRDDLHRR